MINSDFKLQRGQALVLVGAQGCGKSTLARAIARRHGSYTEIGAAVLSSTFALGSVLSSEPETVIVEGLPTTQDALSTLKALITSEATPCNVKGRPLRSVRTPNFIFCSGDANPLPQLSQSDRRFFVVQVPQCAA